MTDVLIRNISDETLSRVDAMARRAGLSRAEYLRRTIDREALRSDEAATIEDLRKFDRLADEQHMSGAWG
ncbi:MULTISPECIES: type II toxin-antitoxin system VapB family antitoxin [Brevibacterium]|uniref:Uncharacterized protein n=2 Tax=Brevibacterium linens TaxID=1703 RepID=A0A2H1KCQ5_BRELN|nr:MULTISPECIES: hypothetical protein [Brevibacterium]AZU02214.1 hypothetical protein CXR29_00705 [Brevibacterium linens]KAB1942535.1 hypothetical protein F8227_16895 [Brevibacterium linens ATCC 9172]SMX97466.1 hypothetical protein BLIN101_03223 [Brevibacterium linens]SMX98645.1 hypothetical protein BLIN9172_03139 [Brevibacterium linens ATCC 9172]